MKMFQDLKIWLTMSFCWRQFTFFNFHSVFNKTLFHFTPQNHDVIWENAKKSLSAISTSTPSGMVENGQRVAKMAKQNKNTKTMWFESTEKCRNSLQLLPTWFRAKNQAKNWAKIGQNWKPFVSKGRKKPLLSASLQRRCTTKGEAGRC